MTDQPFTCQLCEHTEPAGAYHPYAFCVLYKAGLDPWKVVRDAAKAWETPDLPDGYRYLYTATERRERPDGGTYPPRVIVHVHSDHGNESVGSAYQEVGPDLDIHALEQEAYDDARQRILTEAREAETRAQEWRR